jgi:branched-chain amino acid transport system substrate-binding protein
MKNTLKILLGGLLLSSSSVQAQVLKPLEVALVAPLSGDSAAIGKSLRFAATLALINSRKEFEKMGFDLKLKTYDDKTLPSSARAQGKLIAGNTATLVVVGSYASDTSLALAETLSASGVSLVSPTASSNAFTDRNLPGVNRIVARNDQIGQAAGQYIQKALKSQRVLLLDDNSADGRDVSRNLASYLNQAKVSILSEMSTSEKLNFSKVVGEIKAAKPDLIFLGFISVESSARIIGKIRRSGIKTPIMGTSVLADPQFRALAGSNSSGVLYASYVAPVEAYANPAIPTFVKQFQQVLQVKPTSYSVLGYDAMNVALEGLKSAIKTADGKKPTREQVQTAVRAVKLNNGLSGALSFNAFGDLERTNVYVLKIGADFKPKLVSILPAVPGR